MVNTRNQSENKKVTRTTRSGKGLAAPSKKTDGDVMKPTTSKVSVSITNSQNTRNFLGQKLFGSGQKPTNSKNPGQKYKSESDQEEG